MGGFYAVLTNSTHRNRGGAPHSVSLPSIIVYGQAKIDRFFVNAFPKAYEKLPKRIVLDLDTTDDEFLRRS